MNSTLRKSINVMNMFWRKYKKNKSQENWEMYKKLCYKITQTIYEKLDPQMVGNFGML